MIYMSEKKVLGIDMNTAIPISDILSQRVSFDESDERLKELKENYKNSLTVEDFFDLVTKLTDDKTEIGKTPIKEDGIKIVNKDGKAISSLGDIIDEIEY